MTENLPAPTPETRLQAAESRGEFGIGKVPDVRGYRPVMAEDGQNFIVDGQHIVPPEKFWAFVWWLENRSLNPRLAKKARDFSGRQQKEFGELCLSETGFKWTEIVSWRRKEWFKALEVEILGDRITDYRHRLTQMLGVGADGMERVLKSDDPRGFGAIVAANKILTEMDPSTTGPVVKRKLEGINIQNNFNDNRQVRVNVTVDQVRQMSAEDISDWFFNKQAPQPKQINPGLE